MRLSYCLLHPLPFTHPRLHPPPVLTSGPMLGLLNLEGKKKLERESETARKPLSYLGLEHSTWRGCGRAVSVWQADQGTLGLGTRPILGLQRLPGERGRWEGVLCWESGDPDAHLVTLDWSHNRNDLISGMELTHLLIRHRCRHHPGVEQSGWGWQWHHRLGGVGTR